MTPREFALLHSETLALLRATLESAGRMRSAMQDDSYLMGDDEASEDAQRGLYDAVQKLRLVGNDVDCDMEGDLKPEYARRVERAEVTVRLPRPTARASKRVLRAADAATA